MRLLFLLCCCLLPLLGTAQTTVSGQVVDAKTGDGLPGATVLQTATTNGVSSDAQGRFTFSVPGQPDSVALTISSIGYLTQRRRVAAGSALTVRLVADEKRIECLLFVYPLVEIGVASGVRYAPFGGTVQLDGRRLANVPLTATIGYQTNFSRNHVLAAGLSLPPLLQRRFTVSEALGYQHLQVAPGNIRFQSYTATVSVGPFRTVRFMPWVTVLAGSGYAHYQSERATEAGTLISGIGYTIGLQNHYYIQPFRLAAAVQATRWPGYWQWQARLTHPFGRDFQAGFAFNQLPSYAEVSVLLKRTFY